MTQAVRVAVIGAGLSGLATALRLVKLGHLVTVFEARERVGGRVWSETITAMGEEHVIERGAEFVIDGYSMLREYCETYGLTLVDTGMSYYIRVPADRRDVTTENLGALGKAAAEEAALITGARSVAEVLDRLDVSGPTREALEARIEMSTAVRVDQVTAEKTLDHVASFDPLPSWRIGGGNQSLPNSMAAELGDRVKLSTAVVSIREDGDRVLVRNAGDERAHEFDYVVSALPFGILNDSTALDIDLPRWKREAMSRVVQGNAAKLQLALDRVPDTSAVMSVSDRFWTWTARAQGDGVSPVLHCFGGELDRLKSLGVEHGQDEWEQRVRALRSDLSIGSTRAVLTAWSFDPLARGAYCAHAPGFSSEDADALVAPHGRVYFAGEYTDREYVGLMEGALRSGHRAAEAIEEQLAKRAVA